MSGTACVYSVTSISKAADAVLTLATTTVGNGPAPLTVGQSITVSGATGTGWSIVNTTHQVKSIDVTGLLITVELNTSAVAGTLGGTITASNVGTAVAGYGRMIFAPIAALGGQGVSVTAITSLTKLECCHIDDEALLDAGEVFGVKFKERLSEGRFAEIRFLNWMIGNGSNVTTWDTSNRPEGYVQYQGAQTRTNMWAGSTTNSGSNYSMSAPATYTGTAAANPPDKSLVHVNWNVSPPTRATVTFAGGTTATINWTANGQTIGNRVYFDTQGGTPPTPAGFYYQTTNAPYFPIKDISGNDCLFWVVAVTTNTIEVSATSGGAPFLFATTGTGTTTCRTLPTLSVGSSLPKPILDRWGGPPTGAGGTGDTYPIGGTENSFGTAFYDAFLGGWLFSRGGLQNGVPFNLMMRLCKEVGAHPWFVGLPYSLSPMTDLIPEQAAAAKAYCIANGCTWMVPRFEPPNETWLASGTQTGYAQNVAGVKGWGANVTGMNNLYGQWLSTIGQAVNLVYGGDPRAGTLYKVVLGVSAASMIAPASNDVRATGGLYIGTTPQSGYSSSAGVAEPWRWCQSVCLAGYYAPWQYGYNQEVPMAFDYHVTYSANPTQQAIIAAEMADGLVGGGACAIANGSPAVVTLANHGFVANQLILFYGELGYTLPTGLSVTGVNYYVLPTDLTTHTFKFATSELGTAVNLSGSTAAGLWVFPSATSQSNMTLVQYLYKNTAKWADQYTIPELSPYEVGYGTTGYSTNPVTSPITAATNANPMVLTLTTTNVQSLHTAQSNVNNPAARTGMYLKLSSLTGDMAVFNGQTVRVESVSGVTVTTNLNASAAATGFTGNALATYWLDAAGTNDPMYEALNALRAAAKKAPILYDFTLADYNALVNTLEGGCQGLRPSLFQLGGPPNATYPWSVLEDVYETDPPQWNAIVDFNN